jgi:hypothetical protein
MNNTINLKGEFGLQRCINTLERQEDEIELLHKTNSMIYGMQTYTGTFIQCLMFEQVPFSIDHDDRQW